MIKEALIYISAVIPAQAGIQRAAPIRKLDCRLRGNDIWP